ncbi:MAG: hypothetical protein HYY31_03630 [Chloroflexi bacterium]|nr:hypothetical protein [Chloroflexota bacterium]
MVTVPGFLLRRLYVKGSLRNNEDGFQFHLKNTLGSGYARKMHPLALDGQPIPLDNTSFHDGSKTSSFSEVSEEKPFTLVMNRGLTILVRGAKLSVGAHKVEMSFDVPGLGTLRFDFTDAVQAG